MKDIVSEYNTEIETAAEFIETGEKSLEQQSLSFLLESIELSDLIPAKQKINSVNDFSQEQKEVLAALGNLYRQIELNSYALPSEIFVSLNDDKKAIITYALNWNLWYAARHNQIEIIKILVEQCGQAVNQPDDFRQTCLHKAARSGHDELCAYLLSKGADPTLKDQQGQLAFPASPALSTEQDETFKPTYFTPRLSVALAQQSVEIRKLMTYYKVKGLWIYRPDKKPTVDLTKEQEIPDLYLAVEFDTQPAANLIRLRCAQLAKNLAPFFSNKKLKIILKADDFVVTDTQNIEEVFLLGQSQDDCIKKIKSLLQKSQLISLTDFTAKFEQLTTQQQKALVQLGKWYFDITPPGQIQENTIYILFSKEERNIIDYAAHWNQFICAGNGDIEALTIMRFLLNNEINVNERDRNYGSYCLHKACFYGHWQMCVLLLSNGADPTLKDKDGNLPFADRIKFLEKQFKHQQRERAQRASPLHSPQFEKWQRNYSGTPKTEVCSLIHIDHLSGGEDVVELYSRLAGDQIARKTVEQLWKEVNDLIVTMNTQLDQALDDNTDVEQGNDVERIYHKKIENRIEQIKTISSVLQRGPGSFDQEIKDKIQEYAVKHDREILQAKSDEEVKRINYKYTQLIEANCHTLKLVNETDAENLQQWFEAQSKLSPDKPGWAQYTHITTAISIHKMQHDANGNGYIESNKEQTEKQISGHNLYGLRPILNTETFVFRPQIAEIHQKLSIHPRETTRQTIQVALVGMSGNGKTKLALQYFLGLNSIEEDQHGTQHAHYEPRDRYTLRIWIQADNDLIFKENLLYVANSLSIALQLLTTDTDENKIQKLLRWLEATPGWLLVLDNLSQDSNSAYMPKCGGHVLITSQYPNWQGEVSVPTMKDEQESALQLFRKVVGVRDIRVSDAFIEDMQALFTDVGYLPLAISGLGVYLRQHCDSVASCRKEYADKKSQILREHSLPANDIHAPIALAWDMNFQKLRESREVSKKLALPLLYFCIFIDVNRLTYKTLEKFFAETLKPGLQTLGDYSMLEINPYTGIIYIHTMIQDVIRASSKTEAMRMKGASLQLFVITVSEIYAACSEKAEKIRWAQEFIFHMLALEKNVLTAVLDKAVSDKYEFQKSKMNLYTLIAASHGLLGNIGKKKEYLIKKINFIQSLSNNDFNENLIEAIKNLATIYQNQNNFLMERKLLLNLLQRRKALEGEQSFLVAVTWLKLALNSLNLNDFNAVKSQLNTADEISKTFSSKDQQEDIAKGIRIVSNKLYFAKLDKIDGVAVTNIRNVNFFSLFSLPLLDMALGDYEHDQNNPLACQKVADQYFRMNKLPEAMQFYLKALELDANSIHSRTYLARCYQLLGNQPEAKKNISTLVSTHPLDPGAYIEQGMFLYRQSQLDKAILAFQKAIEFLKDNNMQLSFTYDERNSLDAYLPQEITRDRVGKLVISAQWLAHYMLILCYFAKMEEEKVNGVMKQFVKIIEAEPTPCGYRLLSYVNNHMGKIEEAKQYQEKASALNAEEAPVIIQSDLDEQHIEDESLLEIISLEPAEEPEDLPSLRLS